MRLKYLILLIFLFFFSSVYSQQDMDLHLTDTYLKGKNILKVKRDFHDPYLWVLAKNNEVYRINSLTYDIDDFTSQFSSYSALPFIDIAGVSADTVFIASNSTSVIEYKKGAIKILSTPDGIAGTVNSIGVNGAYHSGPTIDYLTMAFIATNKGLCRYNYKTETMLPVPIVSESKVFESSYRTEIFHGNDNCYFCTPDTVDHYVVTEFMNYTIFATEIYLGGNSFGSDMRSVFFISGNPYNPNQNFTTLGYHFWATENGVFQTKWDHSYWSGFNPVYHYLKGTDVTKISSIYGLLDFGNADNPGLAKENLLIGSSQGLYYSNSVISKQPTFFHFDGLGNKRVNDICVNANSYDLNFKYSFLSTNNGNVCEDGIWVAADDGLYLITPDYAPYVSPTQKIQAISFDGDNYSATQLEICSGTSVTASVNTATYSGNVVQWYKDGLELSNQSNKSITITEAGDYNAILYSPCSGVHFETNHLKVTEIASPIFTFNYPDKLGYCDGSVATLKTDNNAIYTYRWYKDGVLNGNTTSSIDITQAGKYKLEVSTCSGSWVPTKEVQVDFIKVPLPTITTDKTVYCAGDQATLSTSLVNDGNYTINWSLDGVIMPGNQNKNSIITNNPGAYTLTISSNLAPCSQSSTPYILNFEAPPQISLERVITTTLCDGQSVDLKATYSGGTITWSTGETTDKITVNQSAYYTATVKTTAGCEVFKDINVQFFPNPVLSVPDATLCQFTNQTITLTAPAGFTKYEWNGKQGTSSFSTGQLGKVNLVVTDNNGCTASQTINITSHCDDIHLPNTFTPNGDGINDTWTIAGLEGDESTTVKIYNRYGEMVFQSKGYSNPWNGTINGKKLPGGVYYYVINAHQSRQILSGNVTIIY
ncbi:MAG: hypothetical protein JWR50_2749 [Mucilaginibacter sp.]|nr:hypothetical protein [Mucilaginibacter sp.]